MSIRKSIAILLAGMCSCLGAGAETVFTSNTTIAAGNLAYEGANIGVQGCIVTVEGNHSFGALSIRSAGTFNQRGTNLVATSVSAGSNCTFNLAGGATLQVSGDLTLTNSAQLVALATNRDG